MFCKVCGEPLHLILEYESHVECPRCTSTFEVRRGIGVLYLHTLQRAKGWDTHRAELEKLQNEKEKWMWACIVTLIVLGILCLVLYGFLSDYPGVIRYFLDWIAFHIQALGR